MSFRKKNKKTGFSELLIYSHMITPDVIQLKNGGFLAGFWLRGPDLESSTFAELEYLSENIARIMSQLDTHWCVHFEFFRKETHEYPSGKFKETTSHLIDLERFAQFGREGGHYESLQAIFFTYVPSSFEQNSIFRKANKIISGETSGGEDIFQKQLKRFEDVLLSISDSLSIVMEIRRMTYIATGDTPFGGESELLQAINVCVNNKWHPVKLPNPPMYLDCLLAMDAVNGHRLEYDNEYVLNVSIANYPAGTMPGILEELQKLPMSMRWSNRFILTDQRDAVAQMDARRRKWSQKIRSFFSQATGIETSRINQDALAMVGDLDNAIQLADGGEICFGLHTCTVVLRNKDWNLLNEQAREVVKVFEKSGANARIENLNNFEAFLGSLPGHGHENIRKPLINSLNFADIIPLSNDWVGEKHNPCPFYPADSPALLQAATTGSTPFSFNLHVGDVAHTLMIGTTGSGKSTALCTIAAQFQRYENAQIFYFDNGRSVMPLAHSLRNSVFYNLGLDADISLCPLAEIDQSDVLEWAGEWLETIIEMVDPGAVTPPRRILLLDALKNLAKSTDKAEQRTISQYITSLQDERLKAALEFYSLNQSGGLLLDGDRNDITYSVFTVFEIGILLERDGRIASAVLSYLFFQIQRRLKGQPSLVVVDEAWTVFKHPMFAEKIRGWLKTFRKLNCGIVLATQSISDVIRSEIRDAVFESCPTKILLANPEARGQKSGELYRDYLQFNERQISLIATLQRKREYYAVSPKARRVFTLGLGPVALAFVGASGMEDLTRIEALKEEHGYKWPAFWLRERSLGKWADKWLELDAERDEINEKEVFVNAEVV